ncbi:spore coat protein [Candidatus Kaiserbacteria bacterium]|nr:spore coat protein [Candidatus Kaiserbacteria bacterium]
MKGVILAGGSGTRLAPLTLATNKHLLPLYDRPIIYYSIEKLIQAGVARIMIVTSGTHIEDFVKLLGSGQNFRMADGRQLQIVYGIQNEPRGICEGLHIAADYVGVDNCVLMLGDNIFEDDLLPYVRDFRGGATIFLKQVPDPHRFGVAEFDKHRRVIRIEEKPKKPKSDYAVTGCYIYDPSVFKKLLDNKLSARGEFEIGHVNNKYAKDGTLGAVVLKQKWFDVGTFDSLLNASLYMKKKQGASKK